MSATGTAAPRTAVAVDVALFTVRTGARHVLLVQVRRAFAAGGRSRRARARRRVARRRRARDLKARPPSATPTSSSSTARIRSATRTIAWSRSRTSDSSPTCPGDCSGAPEVRGRRLAAGLAPSAARSTSRGRRPACGVPAARQAPVHQSRLHAAASQLHAGRAAERYEATLGRRLDRRNFAARSCLGLMTARGRAAGAPPAALYASGAVGR